MNARAQGNLLLREAGSLARSAEIRSEVSQSLLCALLHRKFHKFSCSLPTALGGSRKSEASTQDLAQALAHPLRRAIVRSLDGEPTSPRQLTDPLEDKLSNVAYHFRVLADMGAVKLVGTKAVRGSTEHFYIRADDLPDWAMQLVASED